MHYMVGAWLGLLTLAGIAGAAFLAWFFATWRGSSWGLREYAESGNGVHPAPSDNGH